MSRKVISFHYTLTNTAGETLDTSSGREPLTFLGGSGQIIPGLEKELANMKSGDKKVIQVKAADAYGEHDKALLGEVPRAAFPTTDLKVGDQFQAQSGDGRPRMVTVTEVGEETVKVDANHPLSGQDLKFDVEVTEVRDATDEEMSHGHVHGAGGHHH